MPEVPFDFDMTSEAMEAVPQLALDMNRLVIRPLLVLIIGAFYVSLLAAQRGHNRFVWFLASFLNPFLAVYFAAQDAGRWRRREQQLQACVEGDRYDIFAEVANPFPDFGPANMNLPAGR